MIHKPSKANLWLNRFVVTLMLLSLVAGAVVIGVSMHTQSESEALLADAFAGVQARDDFVYTCGPSTLDPPPCDYARLAAERGGVADINCFNNRHPFSWGGWECLVVFSNGQKLMFDTHVGWGGGWAHSHLRPLN